MLWNLTRSCFISVQWKPIQNLSSIFIYFLQKCNFTQVENLLAHSWFDFFVDTMSSSAPQEHNAMVFYPKPIFSFQKMHHQFLFLKYPVFSGLRVLSNKIWWLCLLPTSTTRFASDVGYRMAIKWVGLYKEILFMNNDIKFLNIEWRTPYPLTNFEDCVGLRASVIFLYSNMCGFLFICTLASSQTLVVKWQN